MRRALACLLGLALATPANAAAPPAVEAANGMVVSAQHLATRAGVEMLKRGGNAIDAAVAVGYAQAVTNPCCGNIGGGGFMTLHLADGRDAFIDFRETAPAAATKDMFLDATGKALPGASLFGWKAAGVPGTVLGLDTALAKYGTLPRAIVMEPAIRMARDGFILTRGDTDILDLRAAVFRRVPEFARLFLRPDGTTLQPGDRLIQPDLATTIAAIATAGPPAFYAGRIPAAVEAASRANGGILAATDFAAYRVNETAPLSCTYRGFTILSAPPPSSGGTALCEILNILEGYDISGMGVRSAKSVHLTIEALRHAYLDRNTDLGDPAFIRNPLDRLLSKDYAAAIRALIGPVATPSTALAPGVPPHEKPQTTHFSVADTKGNAVAVTYTINGAFGAIAMAPATGFFINNEMDDFTIRPGTPNLYGLVQGEANSIAPGKRPLSSMAPTIVMKDNRVFLVLGSPGGSRIITIVLQTLLNIIDHGMDPQEAVDAPRLHHQWMPDLTFLEPDTLSPDTEALLRAQGHAFRIQRPWGSVELIAIGPTTPIQRSFQTSGGDGASAHPMRPGLFYGASDSRRPAGLALGP